MPAARLAAIAPFLMISFSKNHKAILPIEIFGLERHWFWVVVGFLHNKKDPDDAVRVPFYFMSSN